MEYNMHSKVAVAAWRWVPQPRARCYNLTHAAPKLARPHWRAATVVAGCPWAAKTSPGQPSLPEENVRVITCYEFLTQIKEEMIKSCDCRSPIASHTKTCDVNAILHRITHTTHHWANLINLKYVVTHDMSAISNRITHKSHDVSAILHRIAHTTHHCIIKVAIGPKLNHRHYSDVSTH
jgi:hypothetical protein